MFVGDEVRAEVSSAVAAARLASHPGRGSVILASHEAWTEVTASIGSVPGVAMLADVYIRDPVQRGAITSFALRWVAISVAGPLFPLLDADISLAPDGHDATLIGLAGVYGPPAGSARTLDQAFLHRVATATVRSFLSRIATALAGPGLGLNGTGHSSAGQG